MLREEHLSSKNPKNQKLIKQENSYEMGKMIGQGTFGKVYEAIDTKTGKKYAIKEVFQDKRYKNREFEIISRLDNDNIIYMRDYYFTYQKDSKYLHIVMDVYDTSLQALFKEFRKNKKVIPVEWTKILAFQLFKGLYYLRNNSVCHRDLKPPNILLNLETLQLTICDFGSAKIFEHNEKNVSYICSRYYRAPQLLFSYSLYKTQIDVWSAGCILAQFMTKQPIFPGDSALEQLIEIMKVIGTPSTEYLQKYGTQMGDMPSIPKIPHSGWARLFKRYKPDPLLVDLISKILVYDINERFTPFEVLCHPYFHDISSPELKDFTSKIPHLFDFNKLRMPRNGKQIMKLQQLYINPFKVNSLHSIMDPKEEKLETGDNTPQLTEANT